MRIHVAGSVPWPYGPPGNLEAPASAGSFAGFIDRLARFSQAGILDMGARVLWYPWQKRIQPDWQEVGFAVTEVFGPDVIGLAMMHCPATGLDAEELDFRHLCWELFSCGSFADPESVEAANERARCVARWSELLASTPFARLDATAVAQQVRGLWMLGRLLTTDGLPGLSVDDDVLRVVLLHEALERQPGPKLQDAYDRFRNAYFRNDVVRLLQHGFGLVAQVTSITGGQALCPGRFDVHAGDEHQLPVVDFTQFGHLACTPLSRFREMGALLAQMPEHERKMNPGSRPLALRPGVLLDDRTDMRAVFYPSPRRLVRGLRRVLLDDFVEALAEQPGFEHASSLLGQAVHAHLSEVIDGYAISIDDTDCPVQGQKPDAVWCGERFGVVVEAKARLTPRTDPECVSPDSLLVAWSRAWEAVEQADAFLRDPRTGPWLLQKMRSVPDVWVLILLVDESGVAERTAFRHVTSRWQLLSRTKLAGVGLYSFGALEAVLRTQSPDSVGRMVERAWMEAGVDALEQPPEEPRLPAASTRPAYLERAFNRLLAASE